MNKETIIKTSIIRLNDNIQACNNLEEIKEELNILLSLVYRYASKNNNRHNKALKVFEEYLKIDTREKKVSREINRKSEKTFEDFLPVIINLRDKKLSYQKIANYLKKYYNIQVSREKIRYTLKEVKNV